MLQDVIPRISADYTQSPNRATGAARVAMIAPLYLCMVAGTGGVYTPVNISMSIAAHQNSVIEIRGSHSKRSRVLSISQHLTGIREMFDLTMTEVSLLFGVTRPAAYAWINGASEPKPEVKAEICRVSRYVEEFRRAGISKLGDLARRPVVDGKSLVDLLCSSDNVQSALQEVKYTATHRLGRSPVLRDFGPASKTTRVNINDISIPVAAKYGET